MTTGAIELTKALKRCLRSRGVTYAALAETLGLSEASVKRLFSAGGFTLERIEQVCRVVDIDLYELARLARRATSTVSTLTSVQEQALAANPRLLVVFHLLLNGWKTDEILSEYRLSRAEYLKLLLELDRLHLIELRPDNEARLHTACHISWRRDGPMRRAYRGAVLEEFFGVQFDGPGEILRFEAKELSAESRQVIGRKLEQLAREVNELAEIDAVLKPEERESIGLLLAFRPYVLSLFTQLKRAPKDKALVAAGKSI
jgi:DNA-binding Xre family transcriptional regulator